MYVHISTYFCCYRLHLSVVVCNLLMPYTHVHFQSGGDKSAVAREMAAAEAAFSAAVALKPEEPQAYANLATALHNSNDMSRAVDAWDATLERVDDKRT